MKTPTVHAAEHPVVFDDHSSQRIEYTTCYMCACRCGIKVTLDAHDKVRFIQGNPNHPVNRGVLCAKGSAGIMKQYSPAKLTQPLRRKRGAERGSGQLEPISWDEALAELTERLAGIRATDPRKLAFFTGRDQMQALTGLWAQQYGTPNWAAHGGFCSVNMAAGGLYSIGYAFWEFGAPDWDRTRYFVLWGVAEDHNSNPIKTGIDKLKSRGAKFVSVNPVRTGYSAVADEWLPIRPGTDGLLAGAIVHVLLQRELFDWDFLVRTTNASWLVIDAPGTSRHGLFLRNEAGQPLVFDQASGTPAPMAKGVQPALFGEFDLAGAYEGTKVRTSMTLMAERFMDARWAPAAVADQCGVPAGQIERIALEMASVAFEETIELPIAWTDVWGNEHDKVIGRPVTFFAMRGVSAHSNGFQTCRTLHLIQMLLGALDGPGSFRSRAPFPRPVPPPQLPENDAALMAAPDKPLAKPPLGFPVRPEDLAVDENGNPLRIDKAYSWESPIAAHGMMHMVIRNAVAGDPYPIDTLMLFMANMAWNSSMNTADTQKMLTARREDGEYKIPYLVVCDAFDSETVRYADLVLPDTTYLERFDTISILDRPISEVDAVADAIRHPVVPLDRDVRPWQEVLVDLASRLKFPAFVDEHGAPRYSGYQDFIARWEKSPGIGFLAGWRGENGDTPIKGAPNPKQWDAYVANESHFTWHWPENMQYNRGLNRDYLQKSAEFGFIGSPDPIIMQIYSEPLQKFRLAGQGLYDGPRPPREIDRERLSRYFDPLPDWYPPLEGEALSARDGASADGFDFHAITQRPAAMYHAWDSQNGWLRQIHGQNYLYMNDERGFEMGLADDDWVWVESHNGRIRCQIRLMAGVERNTVWTWNAIGKMSGTWGLAKGASESSHGFLLNHLISESLPRAVGEAAITNSDPVTGQAAWYDLKVRITKAGPGETGTWPHFEAPGRFGQGG
ncbi:MAG: molybdopterin oxidoreductase family protein [Burkholderiaceae bacterium]